MENKFRLFGCGALNNYGTYTLAVADSKEMAYEILSKNEFNKWKERIYHAKDNSNFDQDGKPLNGNAMMTLEYEEMGLYNMNEETLFTYYKNNEFPIDDIVDLNTNIWNDEHA